MLNYDDDDDDDDNNIIAFSAKESETFVCMDFNEGN